MTGLHDDRPTPAELPSAVPAAPAVPVAADQPSVETSPTGSAYPESPYLGLRSFAEADRELFHGREAETSELLHLVQRETLSIVFGRSGLGKSSLLRAGLFPRLRDAGLFPIAVRLSYGERQLDLVAQIRAAIAAAIAEHSVDAAAPSADQTLWEYFHRTPFWSVRNRPLIPVLAIDQFEELFTLGRGDPGRAVLLAELGDLVENRIPAAVRASGDADALPPAYQVPKAKLILALREDYLARIEDLRVQIPSIARGRFRLRAMDGAQAVRAVRHDRTAHLVELPVAERIVRFVAGGPRDAVRAGEAGLDDLTIEPALLSLVCRQLDEIRRDRSEPVISADLLTGQSTRILDDFYERSVADLDPGIVAYLEDHLLTPSGHRTTMAMSQLAAIAGMEPAVTTLVDRRLLRIEVRLEWPHVEVIHDVLTRVMVARRERRRIEHERRRRAARRIAAIGAGALLALLATATVLYLGARQRLVAAAEQQRAAVEAERRANAQRSATTLAAEASSMLARNDVWSAARVLQIAYGITGQDSSPGLGMLVGRITALDAMLAAVLQPRSGVTALVFSADGTTLFAGHQDGTVSMWSTSDGKMVAYLAKGPPAAAASRVAPGFASGAEAELRPEGVARRVRTGPVQALGVSDDGRYAVATDAVGDTTIWDTATQQVLDTIGVERGALHISHDGAWIVAANGYSDRLFHAVDGHYAAWKAPPISALCPPQRRPTQFGPGAPASARQIGISGDGSTLVVHHYEATEPGSAGDLSVFRLGPEGPSPLMTGCVPARERVVEVSVNSDGTLIALEEACDHPDGCETTAAVYRRDIPWQPLGPVPAATRLAFDGRLPALMLATGKERLELASPSDTEANGVRRPCRGRLETDLFDGRLAALGSCGAYVIAARGKATITGNLPRASDSAIRVSAASQLAATLSPDGVIRLWHLQGSPDRALDGGVDATMQRYLGQGRLLAYDGAIARIFAPASADAVATAGSTTAPAVVDDDTVAVSQQGQVGLLRSDGQLRMETGKDPGPPAAALIAARGAGEVVVVAPDLRLRRVTGALQSTASQALDSPFPHTALDTLVAGPSGRWMLGAGGSSLVRFDAAGHAEPPVAFPGGAQDIVPAVHGDGLLAVGFHTVAEWTAAGPPAILETPSGVGIARRSAVWDMASRAVVLGTERGLVRLDASSGRPLWQVPAPFGDKAAITWLDLDAHGASSTILAAASGRMALFSFDDGHRLRELRECVPVAGDSLAGSWFLASGLLVTRSRAGDVALWDARAGECLAMSAKHIADMAHGASDDFAVVIEGQAGFGVLHVRGRRLVLDAPLSCGPQGASPHRVAWSPDGQWIALASPRERQLDGPGSLGDGNWICLWSPITRQTVARWGSHQDVITGLALSAGGGLLSRAGDSTTRLWSTPTGSLVSELVRESLLTVAAVDHRTYLITRLGTRQLRIYDAHTAKLIAETGFMDARDGIACHAVDEASGLLAIGYDAGGGVLIDIRTGKRDRDLVSNDHMPTAIAIAPGGSAIALASWDQVRLWRRPSASTAVDATLHTSHVRALAFSRDGAWLATASSAGGDDKATGLVEVWDMAGKPTLSLETPEAPRTVSWSPDGSQIAVGGVYGALHAFDLRRETRDSTLVARIIDRIAPQGSAQAASPMIEDVVLRTPWTRGRVTIER